MRVCRTIYRLKYIHSSRPFVGQFLSDSLNMRTCLCFCSCLEVFHTKKKRIESPTITSQSRDSSPNYFNIQYGTQYKYFCSNYIWNWMIVLLCIQRELKYFLHFQIIWQKSSLLLNESFQQLNTNKKKQTTCTINECNSKFQQVSLIEGRKIHSAKFGNFDDEKNWFSFIICIHLRQQFSSSFFVYSIYTPQNMHVDMYIHILCTFRN